VCRNLCRGSRVITPVVPVTRQLRARHWSRYLDALFLLVWLLFWVVGEVVAFALVVVMIASGLSAALGRPPWMTSWAPPTDGSVTVFLFFLLLWLTLWTVGGIAAGTQLLRRLGGEDCIDVTPNGVTLTWRAGPIRRRREIPRASIRRVRLSSTGDAVVADTDSGTVVISDLGDDGERRSLHAWLSSQLALPGEEHARLRERELQPLARDVDTQGAEIIVTHPTRRLRMIHMRVMLFVATLMSLGWIDALRRGFMTNATTGESLAAVATLLVAASSVWFMTSRREWVLRSGRMSVRRRVAHWTFGEHDFSASSTIEIEHHQDSDGDDRYALVVKDSVHRRVLDRSLHDQYELLALGEWLSARTGFNFKRQFNHRR
jgi:hypothetical protein